MEKILWSERIQGEAASVPTSEAGEEMQRIRIELAKYDSIYLVAGQFKFVKLIFVKTGVSCVEEKGIFLRAYAIESFASLRAFASFKSKF